jgi:hypothetical protein
MPTKIKLVSNYINDIILFTPDNDNVIIQSTSTDNNVPYKEDITINSELENYIYKNEYYIYTNYYDTYTSVLNKFNFVFNFNSNRKILYDYNFNKQTIYFYYESIEIPFSMIGLINFNQNISVFVECTLNTINDTTQQYINVVSLINNNLTDNNIIIFPGGIVSLNSLSIYSTRNLSLNYYLLNTPEPIIISDLTKIYFYNPNFIRIINIPITNVKKKTFNTVNILVELIGGSGEILYSYIINLNINFVNSIEKTSNAISFLNYVQNIQYESIVLRVFDYDYYTYFSELSNGDFINCKQITLDKANLYDLLINTNTNIPYPTILNLNIQNYNIFIGTNLLDDIFMINSNFTNKIVEDLLYSNNEKFLIILNYLINFKIMNYNLYNITFLKSEYNVSLNKTINTRSLEIDSNNLLLNSNLVNIEIYFNDLKSNLKNYNIYSTIFNNNNTWDIYTKKYLLDNPVNKYNLIKDLMIMAINYTQIIVYLYNDIDDLNSTKLNPLVNAGFPYINNYWKYNRLILNRDNSEMVFGLDDNNYLKMYFQIKSDYKMLIFYSDSIITSSPDTTILNFKTEGLYAFKIFKIQNPNGSTQTDKFVYSILFQNIEECNDFIYYIEYGLIKRPPGSTSSYFNFTTSRYFKLDSSGYYILSDSPSNTISFKITNLQLLDSNVFTNNQIIVNN